MRVRIAGVACVLIGENGACYERGAEVFLVRARGCVRVPRASVFDSAAPVTRYASA